MVPLDDLLAPGRALETLVRRAARGHRPAMRLLLRHAPAAIAAEGRWLYPALLHRTPGGTTRAELLPFGGEHEQMLELIERLADGGGGRFDPRVRAIEWLMVRHARAERSWLRAALARTGPRDDPALARYVAACRPLVDAVVALAAAPEGAARAAAR